jgi:hypothetical protein
MTNPKDPAAPHGRDANGTPLAPYGLNVDGSPRKSNRGARRGQGRGGVAAKKTGAAQVTGNLTDNDRKGMLVELSTMLLINPLASMSQVPAVKKQLGEKQADALAGDAFILAQFFPNIADGLILLSKTKPRTLAWLDKAEQNAPYIVIVQALLTAGKAVADNHMNPDRSLAQAGRSLARLRMHAMAEEINRQAAAMEQSSGPTVEDFEQAGYEQAVQNDPTLQFSAV